MSGAEIYQAERARELGYRYPSGRLEEGVGKRYSDTDLLNLTHAANEAFAIKLATSQFSPATKRVIRIAEHEAEIDPLRGGSNLHFIGTDHLYLGLLQLPRRQDAQLARFMDRFVPASQQERIAMARLQREDHLKGLEDLVGRFGNEPNDRPYRLDHTTLPALEYGLALAGVRTTTTGAEKLSLQPIDLLGGVILAGDGEGSDMFFDMADKGNKFYIRLFQATHMADTNVEFYGPFWDAVQSLRTKDKPVEPESPKTEEELRNERMEDLWHLAPGTTNRHPERGDSTNFSFEGVARMLEIPREKWDLPLVRDYVGMINTARQFGHDLEHAQRAYQEAHEHDATNPLNGTIKDRYKFAYAMSDIIMDVLEDGYSDEDKPFTEVVNRYFSDLGLEVVEKREAEPQASSEIQPQTTFM